MSTDDRPAAAHGSVRPEDLPAGAAEPRTTTVASSGPLQPADLIAFLQRTQLSCTQSYDVVSIVSADRVNELFGQEYVTRVAAGEAFAPVNGQVAIGGNQYASFSGLVLGQPLISFSPGAEPQQADLRIEFLSGTVTTEQVVNGVTTVLSTQHVQPGSGFALTGTVPLADVQGQADPNTHEVCLDITNASDFAAHMNIPGAAARTALGQYFLSLMQQQAGSWAYVLGSLNYSADPSMKLVPTSFEIATQVDSADPADTGRVMLFITTAYGTAPPGRPAAMQLPNMVPAGSTTTLIVANRVLLGGLVLDAIQARLASFNGTTVAKPVDPTIPGSLYKVTTERGSVDLGQVKCGPGSWGLYVYYSGYATGQGTGLPVTQTDVTVPLDGIAVAIDSGVLTINTNIQWNQQWACEYENGKYTNAISGTVPMTVSMNGQQSVTVDTSGTIHFGSPPPVGVSFTPDTSFWQGSSANSTAAVIQQSVQPQLQPILSIQLPEVQTFAVNNLLFPSDHNLTFASGYLPGDLVTFGDLETSAVTVTPLYATLAPDQTCRFSASGAGGSTVHWTVGLDGAGSIGPDGTYQAPDVITATTHDVVTAWAMVGGSRQTASAVVTLVAAGLSVSPDYVVMAPGATAQQFVASAAGQAATDIQWTLIGPSGAGTLTDDGVYTPPASVSAMQAVTVQATRSSDGTTANALLILTPYPPEGVQVTPPALTSPLPAGQTQQFTATGTGGAAPGNVTWSVQPAIGTITGSGLYTAPATVTAPTTIAVVATVMGPYVFGIATLQVVPAAPAADPDRTRPA